MKRTLIGLAVMAAMVGATAARADDCDDDEPTYAPQGQSWNQGQYQLQTTQTWVPGQPQQIWVPGACRQYGSFQQCAPGSYQMVATEGHYENRQTWVWVASSYQPRPYVRDFDRDDDGRREYRRREYGRTWHFGRHHGATPLNF